MLFVCCYAGGRVAGLPVVTMDDKEEERHGKEQHLQRYLQVIVSHTNLL